MIRRLTIDDIEQAYNVAITKPIRGETNFVHKDRIIYTLAHPEYVNLGYFEGDELISWSAVKFVNVDLEKVWYIIFFFTKRLSDHFSFRNNDFGPMMDEYFKIAEANEYYTYVYSVPLKSHHAYYRKWKSKEGRYDTFDVAIVPAGTEAPSEWMRKLNGGIRPYDIVMKKRVLKDEFRKNNSIRTNKSPKTRTR